MEEKEIKKKTLEELMESSYKLSPDVLSGLQQAFRADFTVEEACLDVGISKETFYQWIKESDEFAQIMDRAKQHVATKAKKVVANMVENGSAEDAWKYLERRQKKLYSTRSEMTGEDGAPLNTGAEELKKISEQIGELLHGGSTEVKGDS